MSQAPVPAEIRERVMSYAAGAGVLHLAFIGVSTGLFAAARAGGTTQQLSERAEIDAAYAVRWCDAAYAFELLDRDGDTFSLTPMGRAFLEETPGTLMPMAVQAVLGAHFSERAATLAPSGEQPGEVVLGERPAIAPLFGPMLEFAFGPMFAREILPRIPVFAQVEASGGLAVDLGCGNGWYLRKLAARFPNVRGLGFDMMQTSIDDARARASAEGLSGRLEFRAGDLYNFSVDEPAALIAMNRALHHVWERKDKVFRILAENLAPGGHVVIWEPRWPDDTTTLRDPGLRGLAFQNLAEHVQGNHFLRPDEVEHELREAGLEPQTHELMGGREMVVTGRKR